MATAGTEAVTTSTADDDRRRVLAHVDRPERHPGDVIRIVSGVLILILATIAVRDGRVSVTEASIFAMVNNLPAWLEPVFRIVLVAAIVAGIAVPLVALIARHYRLARDTVLSVALAFGANQILASIMERGTPDEHLRRVQERGIDAAGYGYPSPEVAIAAAVVSAASPYLTRTARRVGWLGVGAIGVARIYVGAHLPVDVIGGLVVGWMAGAAVHLAFGSPGGRPTLQHVRSALGRVDVNVADLTAISTGPQRSALFRGHLSDGSQVICRAHGRDERNADALDRAWRSVSLRDADESWFATAGQAVEHEAYLSMRARDAHIGSPPVLATVSFPEGAAIAERFEPGTSLAELPVEQLDDALLARVWEAVAKMRAAHLAHRALSVDNVILTDSGDLLFLDWSRSIAGASDTDESDDIVELLASLSVRVGPERAVASALGVLGADVLLPVLPRLQPILLSRSTRKAIKQSEHGLDGLRSAAASALGVEEPKLQPLTRLRPETILMVVVLLLAIHVLVPQLGEFGEAWQAILDANLAWVGVAIVATALTYVALGVSLLGAIKERVPLLWLSVLQLASAFANKLAPGSVGGLALRVRFFQRAGLATEEAVASVALASAGGGVVRFAFIVIAVLLLGGSGFGDSGINLPSGWVILAAVVVIAAIFGVVIFTTLGRRMLKPVLRGLTDLREVLKHPSKAAMLLGGAALQTVLSIVAFGVSLSAVNAGVGTDTVIVVYIVGTTIGGAAPTPGGLGAVEAALVAGLTAAGVQSDLAVAGVLVFRLITYWLPILPGYLSLHALRKRGSI